MTIGEYCIVYDIIDDEALRFVYSSCGLVRTNTIYECINHLHSTIGQGRRENSWDPGLNIIWGPMTSSFSNNKTKNGRAVPHSVENTSKRAP